MEIDGGFVVAAGELEVEGVKTESATAEQVTSKTSSLSGGAGVDAGIVGLRAGDGERV